MFDADKYIIENSDKDLASLLEGIGASSDVIDVACRLLKFKDDQIERVKRNRAASIPEIKKSEKRRKEIVKLLSVNNELKNIIIATKMEII